MRIPLEHTEDGVEFIENGVELIDFLCDIHDEKIDMDGYPRVILMINMPKKDRQTDVTIL